MPRACTTCSTRRSTSTAHVPRCARRPMAATTSSASWRRPIRFRTTGPSGHSLTPPTPPPPPPFPSIGAPPYPIPHDGPVGQLLDALNRHPWRPAHLHFRISAPGYETLVTHVFRDGDPSLDSDAVFGVRSSLVADWVHHEGGPAPDGRMLDTPFSTLDFDFVLNPARKEG